MKTFWDIDTLGRHFTDLGTETDMWFVFSRCVQKRQGTTRVVAMKLISTSFPKVKLL